MNFLSLQTPNSEQCTITVDGIPCAWYDGQDFIFDETYPHEAHNATASPRLILLCDVERPLNIAGRAFNWFYGFLAKGTLVPNTSGDKRGAFSALFAFIAPWRERSLQLKYRRRGVYKAVKWFVNTLLLCLLLGIVYGVFSSLEMLFFSVAPLPTRE